MKRMKKLKTFVTVLATIAILFCVPGYNSLTASAAVPVTYAIRYSASNNDWRYQSNTSVFNVNVGDRELYYLRQTLKDGDLVVVYYDGENAPALDLGNVRLSNLTVVQSTSLAVIFTGGIDDCYLLAGTSSSINGNVTNAHVYDSALANFNGNVKNLNVYAGNDMTSTIGCGGTVEHLQAASSATTYYNLFNFKAGTFNISYGSLQTAPENYSTVPTATVLTRQNFDYIRYANDYADLKAAFGYNANSLYNHYITHGIREQRRAYTTSAAATTPATTTPTSTLTRQNFDYIRYATDYADLKAAFGYNADALYNHYITYGIKEQRLAYATPASQNKDFDYVRYANDYADLKAAFGYNENALYNHYLTYGIKEGRVAYTMSNTLFN